MLERLDVDRPGRERLRYKELRRMYEELCQKFEEIGSRIDVLEEKVTRLENRMALCDAIARTAMKIAQTTQNDMLAKWTESERELAKAVAADTTSTAR